MDPAVLNMNLKKRIERLLATGVRPNEGIAGISKRELKAQTSRLLCCVLPWIPNLKKRIERGYSMRVHGSRTPSLNLKKRIES